MVSTFTTNKYLELPGNGDYVDTWNVPANGDFSVIDQAFGGVTSLNATSGDATLTASQYRSLILAISGSMSVNVTYTIPAGVGGQWIVRNTTTGGSYTVTIASGGGGTSVTVDRSQNTTIFCDGTNVRLSSTTATATLPGANTQVLYNNSGAFGASANLTFDGAYLSDSIGMLRNVPVNAQTSSYTLQSADNGKLIDITTGGVVVPNSTFAAGNTVTIYNNSGSSQTVTPAGGVTITLVNSGTTGSRTLSAYGLATIACLSANNFIITGSGVL